MSENGGLVFDPLAQFEITPLFPQYVSVEAINPVTGTGILTSGQEVPLTVAQLETFVEQGSLDVNMFDLGVQQIHWYTITNSTLWMGISILCIAVLMVLGTRHRAVIPGRAQSIAELTYGFIYKMVEDVTGKEGVKYFPYVLTLFLFILFANYLALIPMSFSPTSQIAVTAVLGVGVFLMVTILGFVLNGASFLSLFWMKEAPLFLRPIIAVIELISYFVRPMSHSIRLAGNIMAGHAVLKVFATFGAVAALSPVSVLAVVAIYGLEVLVCGIQAYVFTILTCVYLKDALHPHH